jgi:hypothetical protein
MLFLTFYALVQANRAARRNGKQSFTQCRLGPLALFQKGTPTLQEHFEGAFSLCNGRHFSY